MASATGAVLTFRVGDRRMAVDAAEVAEVVRQPRITRVPHAPAALAGITSLRGEVAPVISLATLIGAPAAASASTRVIVLRGSPLLALSVDEVTGLGQGDAQAGALMMTEHGETRIFDLTGLLEAEFAGLTRTRSGGRAPAPQAQAIQSAAEIALLGFRLAGQAYALPLEQVREVLAFPPELATLPRTDAAMLGVIGLRGRLLPVVSTRVLLGLAAETTAPDLRIVVALIGASAIGLVVDELTSIVRAPETAIGPVPRVLNRGAGEAHIDAMLRTPEGGLIAVLAPERLFRDDSVAQILEDGRQKENDMTSAADAGAVYRFLIFTLGRESYGLPIAAVEEVVALPEALTRLPKAPAFVVGVMNLRGAPVPVVDQRDRFGIDGEAPAGRPRVVVTRLGETAVGFAVDAVTEILELPESRLAATPSLAAEAGRLFDRIAEVEADGRMILLVNPQELLDRAEADLLADVVREATSVR